MVLHPNIPTGDILLHYISHQYWHCRQADTIGMLFDGIMEAFELKMKSNHGIDAYLWEITNTHLLYTVKSLI